MTPCIVVLAAGKGKRMGSSLPKVLHPLGGKPLLQHVLQTTSAIGADAPIIVTGYQGEVIRQALHGITATWVTQSEPLGTGHALLTALPHLPSGKNVIVLYGDVPLVTPETLIRLIATTPENALGLVTAHLTDPTGFGRIIRNTEGELLRIVEEKDATESERKLSEINTGIYLIPEKYLQRWLSALMPKNAQGEYYLTDIVPFALTDQVMIHTIQPKTPEEIRGVNTRSDLAVLERYFQKRQAEHLMSQGITFADPARFDLRGSLIAGKDSTIDINVIFEGNNQIGSNVTIGAGCVLRNVTIEDHVEIRPYSILEEVYIAKNCRVGPFARLRPGTHMTSGSQVGNFVEIKNSHIGASSKISHLSYIGDCEMGADVNVGAGTITCNYDGAKKHKTQIGDRAFIGSNSALVAPLLIHADATIGAGSTLTRDAPPGMLTVARTPQRSINGWQRPEKNKEKV